MTLSRRRFLGGAAALPLFVHSAVAQSKKPNVILIITGGLSPAMLGCYGNMEVRTPNIDTLARGGTRFTNCHVVTPATSPSRATLFSGRLPRQHGLNDFLTAEPVENPPQGQATAPVSFKSELLISDWLAGQGYNAGYIGNWDLGDDLTPQHGFKFWYTVANAATGYQDPTMSLNGEKVQGKGYLPELLTNKAGEFVGSIGGQPFFLTLSYPNPRAPYDGHPDRYYKLYESVLFESIGWEDASRKALRGAEYLKDTIQSLRRYAAATTALDDQIGRLVQMLEQKKLVDNTLLVFTSDTGHLLGRHGLWGDGHASDPFNMYEEALLVPMIWNWAGVVPVQQVRYELVSFSDFVPTLSEVINVPLDRGRNLSGHSYKHLVLNQPYPKKQGWQNLIFGQFRDTEMVRDKNYVLILRGNGKGSNELYALAADPRERTNQYDNPAFIVTRNELRGHLDAWRAQHV